MRERNFHLKTDLIRIHQKILEDGNKTRIAKVTYNFTEFSNGSHVLLEPKTASPRDRLHTRRTEPYMIVDSTNNNYTLENLVSKKQLKVFVPI